MISIGTGVSLLLVVLFVSLSIREDGLFKFHPSSMSIAYLGCMFQGIHIFGIDNVVNGKSSIKRRTQILTHSVLQGLAVFCAVAGFMSIYMNKENRQKPHFTSWHGLLGLITFTWSMIQAFAGLFLTIFQRSLRTFGLTYAQARLYHATSGALLFTVSCFVLVLGLVSTWFRKQMPDNTVVYWIIVYCLTSSMLLLAHKTVDQVKNHHIKPKISRK